MVFLNKEIYAIITKLINFNNKYNYKVSLLIMYKLY